MAFNYTDRHTLLAYLQGVATLIETLNQSGKTDKSIAWERYIYVHTYITINPECQKNRYTPTAWIIGKKCSDQRLGHEQLHGPYTLCCLYEHKTVSSLFSSRHQSQKCVTHVLESSLPRNCISVNAFIIKVQRTAKRHMDCSVPPAATDSIIRSKTMWTSNHRQNNWLLDPSHVYLLPPYAHMPCSCYTGSKIVQKKKTTP